MQMKHGLPGRFVAVHYDAIAVFRQALRGRHGFRRTEQAADERLVPGLNVVDRRDMLPRNYYHMRGRLRIDIPKRDR